MIESTITEGGKLAGEILKQAGLFGFLLFAVLGFIFWIITVILRWYLDKIPTSMEAWTEAAVELKKEIAAMKTEVTSTSTQIKAVEEFQSSVWQILSVISSQLNINESKREESKEKATAAYLDIKSNMGKLDEKLADMDNKFTLVIGKQKFDYKKVKS